MVSLQLDRPVLKQAGVGSFICVTYKKQQLFYYISDVATWSKCGHIKTILTIKVILDKDIKKIKKLKSLIHFDDDEQFIMKYGKHHAIYNLRIHINHWNNTDTLNSISLQKIPNLNMCRCGS